jgi:thiol-disulfide isomerase/thioredoxin
MDFEILVYQGQEVLGGDSVHFADVLAQGRPVVLNMWAGLCPTCRAELPHFQELSEAYAEDVLFLGIDVGVFVGLGDKDDALALLEEKNVTYPAGSTPDVTILFDYKILGTPSTYFVTPSGEILRRWNGFMNKEQLAQYTEELIEASGQ